MMKEIKRIGIEDENGNKEDLDKVRGVYVIINKKNNKRYVGESIDIIKRWETHKNILKKNKHHNYELQKDFNEYGLENFEFTLFLVLDNSIPDEVSKYLCLLYEDVAIELFEKDNIELYNSEKTLQNVLSGKRRIKKFNMKEYLKVEDDCVNDKYKYSHGILTKNMCKE